MAKKKTVEKPVEATAPAYMTMYTSLMMLLLAFFIAIMSMATSTTQRGGLQPGIGSIKNSFGMQGGLGLMPYIKMFKRFRSVYPETEEPEEKDEVTRDLLGHHKDTIRKDMIVSDGFLSIKTVYRGVSLRITTPVVFSRGSAVLDQPAREFLQRIGGILNSFPEGMLTTRAYTDETGRTDQDELLAAERAAAVVRYLEQQSGIAPERLSAVGCASTRYVGSVPAGRHQTLILLINKLIDRTPPGALEAPMTETTVEEH